MNKKELSTQICETGRRLHDAGLIVAFEGNISARLNDRTCLITPTKANKRDLKPSDLVVMDFDGQVVEGGDPTSEFKLHAAGYRLRTDCNAIVHAHPPTATGLSLCSSVVPKGILLESDRELGEIQLLPFCQPGTNEIASALETQISDHTVFVLMKHGAVVFGSTLEEACNRMLILEQVSKMYLIALQVGSSISH